MKIERIKLQSIDSPKRRSTFEKTVHRKEKHSGLIDHTIPNTKDTNNNKHVNLLGGSTTNKRFGLLTRRIIDPGKFDGFEYVKF